MKMKVITRNGRVLTSNGAALINKPPYADLWGYAQAKADGTTSAYEWIYNCMADGFSVQARTVDGYSEPIAVDGGAVNTMIVEGELRFHRLNIPIYQFNVNVAQTVRRWVARVVRENPVLCYVDHMSSFPVQIERVNNADSSSRIVYFSLICPDDALRQYEREKIAAGITAAKAKVKQVSGIAPSCAVLTEMQKRNVAKILHDWIMERTSYKTGVLDDQTPENYWSQTAYSALTDDVDVKPVCAGYSVALAYLLNFYGIYCVYVQGGPGSSTSGHAWNLVSFKLPIGTYTPTPGLWSSIDLTIDDNVYDAAYSPYKGYNAGDQCVNFRRVWTCIVPVAPGEQWSAEKWELDESAGDDVTAWRQFCSDRVYGSAESPRRTPNSRGYPIMPPAVPTAYYPYYGSDLYGIAEADWTAPASTT